MPMTRRCASMPAMRRSRPRSLDGAARDDRRPLRDRRRAGDADRHAPTTRLKNDYWLPAATLTWNFAPDMQLRVQRARRRSRARSSASWRRSSSAIPSRTACSSATRCCSDSELYNLRGALRMVLRARPALHARRASTSGSTIRSSRSASTPAPTTGCRPASPTLPRATLYGGEVEMQKYFPLDGLGGDFFATRRAVVIANYTYTKSKITADASCVPNVLNQTLGGCPPASAPASAAVPRRRAADRPVGPPGQRPARHRGHATRCRSDAAVHLCQRARHQPRPVDLSGVGFQPDIIERPGIRLDFVARQGVEIARRHSSR